MSRLHKLADKKDKLKKKLNKINALIEAINQEALTYRGISWGGDLFIECLVYNKHFEAEQPKQCLKIVK